jgi:hypothetical protein
LIDIQKELERIQEGLASLGATLGGEAKKSPLELNDRKNSMEAAVEAKKFSMENAIALRYEEMKNKLADAEKRAQQTLEQMALRAQQRL